MLEVRSPPIDLGTLSRQSRYGEQVDWSMKILMVHDERQFVKVLTAAFQIYRPGYTVIVAHSGMDGLAKAEIEVPDLVILDVMLPDFDGSEIYHRLRARREVPLLLLTAKDAEEEIVQGLEVGASEYLAKPFK